jgi:hypothetical protein
MISNVIKLIGASLFAITTGLFVINKGLKNKDSFNKISGKVILLENNYMDIDERHVGKQKFIQIDNYEEVFNVFNGKDFGDFKPDLDKLTELKIGDEVEIYFSFNPIETKKEPVNRHTQFIYKNNIPLYIKGSADRPLGIFFIASGIGFLVFAMVLNRKKTADLERENIEYRFDRLN